jgi:phospholipid/cholesterol/gamma-HCH transport system substrate-binding protein
MATRKTQYFRLGLLVSVVFVVFTYSLYRISDREGLFGETITLYTDFQDLKGLRTGNNVRYSGIKVGSVTDIQIVSDTCLRVEMLLEADARRYLRQNARAAVGSDGLVGNMLINLSPGPDSGAPLVSDGDFLQTVPQVETADMLVTLSETNRAIASISSQLLSITEKINTGNGVLGRLLNDEAVAADLTQSLRNLRGLTASLQSSAKDLEDFTRTTRSGAGNLGYLLYDTSLQTQVADWSEAVDSLFTAGAEPLSRKLVQAAAAIELASGNIAQLTEELETSSAIQTLLRDTTAGSDIQSTLQHLRTATEKLDENMTALQYSWPFRRYFRRQARSKDNR